MRVLHGAAYPCAASTVLASVDVHGRLWRNREFLLVSPEQSFSQVVLRTYVKRLDCNRLLSTPLPFAFDNEPRGSMPAGYTAGTSKWYDTSNLFGLFRKLISVEIADQSDKVGPPISVLEIRATGYR